MCSRSPELRGQRNCGAAMMLRSNDTPMTPACRAADPLAQSATVVTPPADTNSAFPTRLRHTCLSSYAAPPFDKAER